MIRALEKEDVERVAKIWLETNLSAHGFVKERRVTLTLNVYKENKRAISFYKREGFSLCIERVEEATGEEEYGMIWKRLLPFGTD